jgi:hypothetical protein
MVVNTGSQVSVAVTPADSQPRTRPCQTTLVPPFSSRRILSRSTPSGVPVAKSAAGPRPTGQVTLCSVREASPERSTTPRDRPGRGANMWPSAT